LLFKSQNEEEVCVFHQFDAEKTERLVQQFVLVENEVRTLKIKIIFFVFQVIDLNQIHFNSHK
jgi:hypothetical protein